jgi:hypothetical protein
MIQEQEAAPFLINAGWRKKQVKMILLTAGGE